MTSASNGTMTLSYDGEGRRVKKVWAGSSTVTTVYVYDAMGQLAAEYQTGGTQEAGTRYVTADWLGSTRLVLDGAGVVKARHDYLPFGQALYAGENGRTTGMGYGAAPVGSANRPWVRQLFTGHERDVETDSPLDFMQARYYSGALGRFASPDPENFDARLDEPRSWNMYAYTWNNPLKYVDTDGKAVNAGLALVGAGVGFVTGFGGSAISQSIRDGNIDWSKAFAYGVGGAATGSLAGLTFGGSLLAQAATGAAIGTLGGVGGGAISRGLAGEVILDSEAIEADLVNGAAGGTIGAGVQFLGTVTRLPVRPKAPNPLGSVRTQLRRMAKVAAWQRQRQNLNDRNSVIGGALGAVYGNVAIPVAQAYEARQNNLTYLWLQQQTASSAVSRWASEKVTSKVCFYDQDGKQLCQ